MKKGLNLNKIKNGEKENVTDSIFSRNQDTVENISRDTSVLCVPKLKLNSDNNDVYTEESSDVLRDGTNKNLDKPQRRWKMHLPGNTKSRSSPVNIPDFGDSVTSSNSTEGSVKSSKYSPLSSTSLYNLTKSPLRYDAKNSNPLPRKRRSAYKKLYTDEAK